MMAIAFILGFMAGEAFIFILGLCMAIKRDNAARQQKAEDTAGQQNGK